MFVIFNVNFVTNFQKTNPKNNNKRFKGVNFVNNFQKTNAKNNNFLIVYCIVFSLNKFLVSLVPFIVTLNDDKWDKKLTMQNTK